MRQQLQKEKKPNQINELTKRKSLNVLCKCVFVIVNGYLLIEHISVAAH